MATPGDFSPLFTFPHGNIKILISHHGEPKCGMVSAAVLCLASPVFEELICTDGTSGVSSDVEEDRKSSRILYQLSLILEVITFDTQEDVQSTQEHSNGPNEGDDNNYGAGEDNEPREEGEVQPVPQLDLTADDAEALLVLFNLMHHQVSEVPKMALELPVLLPLAIACQKYDCADIVTPWLHYVCDTFLCLSSVLLSRSILKFALLIVC